MPDALRTRSLACSKKNTRVSRVSRHRCTGLVVAGIDVAKDKVDAYIRSLSQRRTFASTAEGRGR